MPFDLTRALPHLSPIRSADETAPIHAFGASDAPIVRQLSEFLVIHYILDEPGAPVFVRERDVEVGRRAELHARAIENLRIHAGRRKLRFEPRGATYRAKLDGHHDAGLLLLDELWDPPTRVADVEGELVAAVPARDVLLFTGTQTRGGLPELRTAVGPPGSQTLARELLVRRDGTWESFTT
jgi:hypothetical protein